MGLATEQIHDLIKEKFGDAVSDDQRDAVDPFIVVKAASIVDVAKFCRDDPSLVFNLLSVVSGVDYPDQNTIEVVYCLDSTTEKHRLIIKVPLPRDNPKIATLENVWRTADWQERETFDLVGVVFEGHHNLARILCAEDWEGHPLRKDYVIPESYRGIKNVVY